MSDAPKANRLLDAVDALTIPTRSKVVQDAVGDDKPVTTTVVLPSLLNQLDAAIRNSMGAASTRGASLAFEGAVLNTAALFTAIRIANEIRDWRRAALLPREENLSAGLRGWYVRATVAVMLADRESWYLKRLDKWAAQIETMLDPPKERDLPDPCPVCGAAEWWDARDGKRYPRPLIIRYRPTGADMIQQAKGICRACDEVFGVRELAFAIEHAAEATG